MINDIFVVDAVTHPYNFDESNFAVPKDARVIAELSYQMVRNPPNRAYELPPEVYLRDWPVEDLANVLFHESQTDVAVMHPLPINAYHDGLCSVEKAIEARKRYPGRFIGAYAAVDPLTGADAVRSLTEQVEMLQPLGLKLYPNSWAKGKLELWRMDDPKIAYPLYAKALELGITHVAVHKAVPIGHVPVGDSYNPSDLEGAASTFPEMTFEIVHGGLAFLEPTSWLLSRFDNVYVNMEIQNIVLERRPRAFAEILLGLLRVGGNTMLKRLFWGSGTTLHHPRPALEALADYAFPEDLLEGAGLFAPIRQLGLEDKRGLLGENYARLHGLDLVAMKAAIANDEFSATNSGEHIAAPYSTISLADAVGDWRAARV